MRQQSDEEFLKGRRLRVSIMHRLLPWLSFVSGGVAVYCIWKWPPLVIILPRFRALTERVGEVEWSPEAWHIVQEMISLFVDTWILTGMFFILMALLVLWGMVWFEQKYLKIIDRRTERNAPS